MRLPLLVLGALVATAAVSVAALLAALLGAGPHDPARDQEPRGESVAAGRPADPALAVLRRWDAARAQAWSAGDVAALRSLYTTGSVAGDRDVAMLRRWQRRGVRVAQMQTQVTAVQVLARTSRRLELGVVDRLATAAATGRDGPLPLPRDRASSRRLTLRLLDGSWRVASVLPWSPGASAAR